MTRDPHDPERRSKKYRVAFLLLLWSVPAAPLTASSERRSLLYA